MGLSSQTIERDQLKRLAVLEEGADFTNAVADCNKK